MTAAMTALERPVRSAALEAEIAAAGERMAHVADLARRAQDLAAQAASKKIEFDRLVAGVSIPWYRRLWWNLTGRYHRAINWVRSQPRLQAAYGRAGDLARRGQSFVRTGAEMIGTSGFVGLGMIAVSTDTGRGLIDATFGRAVRLAGRVLDKVVDIVVAGLSHLGRPGRYVADHVESGREIAHEAVSFTKGIGSIVLSRESRIGAIGWGMCNLTGWMLVGARAIALASGSWLMLPVVGLATLAVLGSASTPLDAAIGLGRDLDEAAAEAEAAVVSAIVDEAARDLVQDAEEGAEVAPSVAEAAAVATVARVAGSARLARPRPNRATRRSAKGQPAATGKGASLADAAVGQAASS